jgi:hypothetical protein
MNAGHQDGDPRDGSYGAIRHFQSRTSDPRPVAGSSL